MTNFGLRIRALIHSNQVSKPSIREGALYSEVITPREIGLLDLAFDKIPVVSHS